MSIALSIYHIGVEYHVFRIAENCGISYDRIDDIGVLYDQIASNKIVRCDVEQTLFAIPLSQLNLLYSIFVIVIGYLLNKKCGCQKLKAEHNKG